MTSAQIRVPTSLSANDSWVVTGVDAVDAVDNGILAATHDDTDFISTNQNAKTIRYGFSNMDAPDDDTIHVCYIRCRKATGNIAYITARLKVNGIQVHSQLTSPPAGISFGLVTSIVSAATAQSIDYENDTIEWEFTSSVAGNTIYISEIEIAIGGPPVHVTRSYADVVKSHPGQDVSRSYIDAVVANPKMLASWSFIDVVQSRAPIDLSRSYIEVVRGTTEADIDFSRLAVDVVKKAPFYEASPRVTRTSIDVVKPHDTTYLQGDNPLRCSSVWVEVFVKNNAATTDPRLRISTIDGEVFYRLDNVSNEPQMNVTRVLGEVLGRIPSADVDSLRVTRIVGEVLGRIPAEQPAPDLPANTLEPFVPNRIIDIECETVWETDVASSRITGSEDRLGLVEKPQRIMTVTFTGLRQEVSTRLQNAIARTTLEKQVIPFYPDMSELLLDSSGALCICDTTAHRFTKGGYIIVVKLERGGSGKEGLASNYHISKITSVSPAIIEMETPFPEVYEAGSRAYPLMFCDLELSQSLVDITPEIVQATVIVRERPGPTRLKSAFGDESFPYYDGRPVLDVREDWGVQMSSSIIRPGRRFESGRAAFTQPESEQPKFGHVLNYHFTNRNDAWKIISFMDTVRGRLFSFWMVSPLSLYKALAIDSVSVSVARYGKKEDIEQFLLHVGITATSNRVWVRGVQEVQETTVGSIPAWRLIFDNVISLPPSLGDITKVTAAHLARRDEDSFVESWPTNEEMIGSATMISLLEEKEVQITGTAGDGTDAGFDPESIPDLYLWVDASSNTYTGFNPGDRTSITDKTDPRKITTWDEPRTSPSYPYLTSPYNASNNQFYIPYDSPTNKDGRQAIRSLLFSSGGDNPRFILQNSQDPFWDNSFGLTVFIQLEKTDLEDGFDRLLWRNGVIEWTPTQLNIYDTLGVSNPNYNVSTPDITNGDQLKGIAFVWRPGVQTRVYKHGTLVGESVTAPTSLPSNAIETELVRAFGRSRINGILMFRRALSNSELNNVGAYYHQIYGGKSWNSI